MFYSRRDILCSLFWIVIFAVLAYLPFQVEKPVRRESLDVPAFPSSFFSN